jgi:hypothetical protein
VAAHRENLRINNKTASSSIQNFILSRNSTCFGHLLCPLSGVIRRTRGNWYVSCRLCGCCLERVRLELQFQPDSPYLYEVYKCPFANGIYPFYQNTNNKTKERNLYHMLITRIIWRQWFGKRSTGVCGSYSFLERDTVYVKRVDSSKMLVHIKFQGITSSNAVNRLLTTIKI